MDKNKSLLKPQVEELLNKLIGVEYSAMYLYKAISIWADSCGLFGVRDYFKKQSGEEQEHGDKVIDYIVDRNACAHLPAISCKPIDKSSLLDILKMYIEHELAVEKAWTSAITVINEARDETTYKFAQWYIEEQIAEIATATDILQHYNVAANGTGVGYAESYIDNWITKL